MLPNEKSPAQAGSRKFEAINAKEPEKTTKNNHGFHGYLWHKYLWHKYLCNKFYGFAGEAIPASTDCACTRL